MVLIWKNDPIAKLINQMWFDLRKDSYYVSWDHNRSPQYQVLAISPKPIKLQLVLIIYQKNDFCFVLCLPNIHHLSHVFFLIISITSDVLSCCKSTVITCNRSISIISNIRIMTSGTLVICNSRGFWWWHLCDFSVVLVCKVSDTD